MTPANACGRLIRSQLAWPGAARNLLVLFLAIVAPLCAQPDRSGGAQELGDSERIAMLQPPATKPVPVVFDTDTYNEIDDQFALVYALISPELRVGAVYAAPFRNSRSTSPEDGMEKSHEEILRVLGKLGVAEKGLVHKGSRQFIADPARPEESPAARDLIARAKQHHPGNPLYVVAVGAITNVGNALLLEPSIRRNIVVVWLGGNGHEWPNQREFNWRQDLEAARVIFDSGVPVVQLPCTPVVTHFTTTVAEMERYVGGKGAIGDYLLEIFKAYRQDHFGWSKVLWDMTAVAWVINDRWLPSELVHSPIVTDNYTLSFDRSRHMIRYVRFVQRDPIFRDFFTKLERRARQ
jgi:purine nucleosidase